MQRILTLIAMTIIFSISSIIVAEETHFSRIQSTETMIANNSLEVFKSPTCGCCQRWIDHINASGIKTSSKNIDNMSEVKSKYGILKNQQSCHTSVSSEGYVFEGHIPARVIKKFLANPTQNAIGLSVPGMPVGSPGMEMGRQHVDYQVLLLLKNGDSLVYEEIPGHSR
jgi:hypothetical protein